MASLYTIPEQTKSTLKKFRLSSSRAGTFQALVVKIASDHSIAVEDEPITSLDDLAEELPDAAPRFVIVSYPLQKSDGRKVLPYIMLYYRPQTTTQENKMVYAGAVELVRNEAMVQKVIELEDPDDLEELEEKL